MRIAKIAVLGVALLALPACTSLSKTEQGVLSGGALGAGVGAAVGAIGSGTWATGALIGGAIGAAVGAYGGCAADGKC